MKIAILESIIMPAGHEVEFDRILVDELNNQGYEPVMLVPENFPFKIKYNAKVDYLEGGEVVLLRLGVERLAANGLLRLANPAGEHHPQRRMVLLASLDAFFLGEVLGEHSAAVAVRAGAVHRVEGDHAGAGGRRRPHLGAAARAGAG